MATIAPVPGRTDANPICKLAGPVFGPCVSTALIAAICACLLSVVLTINPPIINFSSGNPSLFNSA